MLVNSAIELYTMLLAWHLHNGFWSILSGTGIGAIPFVIVVIKTLLDFQEREGVSSKQIVRALEVKLYSMLFVFFIAVTPLINLYAENTRYYHSNCQANGNTTPQVSEKSFGDSGTNLDKDEGHFAAMMGDKIPQAPLWWYVFSRLNLAVANSLKYELPCRADISSVAANLAKSAITNPHLRDEAKQFQKDCWLPAANKFMRDNPEVPPSLKDDDKSWFGSNYFVTTNGYYNSFRTSKGLKAFDYSVLHGDNIQSDGADGLGWPTCDRWWSDANAGLRKRLIADVKTGTMASKLSDWNATAPSFYSTTTLSDNALLKTALVAPTKGGSVSAMEISNEAYSGGAGSTDVGQVASNLVNEVAAIGALWGGATALLEAQAYKEAAPIIQAFVLMMFVIVLPLLMLLSLYDIGTLVSLTVVQFSVMFWSFLFALAYWLNNFMLSTMMTDDLTDFAVATETPLKIIILTWIVKFSYLLLPLIFSALLSVVGNNLGLSLAGRMEGMMHGVGKNAANNGGKAGSIAGKTVASKFKKK